MWRVFNKDFGSFKFINNLIHLSCRHLLRSGSYLIQTTKSRKHSSLNILKSCQLNDQSTFFISFHFCFYFSKFLGFFLSAQKRDRNNLILIFWIFIQHRRNLIEILEIRSELFSTTKYTASIYAKTRVQKKFTSSWNKI